MTNFIASIISDMIASIIMGGIVWAVAMIVGFEWNYLVIVRILIVISLIIKFCKWFDKSQQEYMEW